MSDDAHVIESDEYREEIDQLKKDTILVIMVKQLFEVTNGDPYSLRLNSFEFMVAVLKEYTKRCEEQGVPSYAKTIGGPVRAVRELIEEELRNYDDGA